jgi:hypothetical protein
MSKLNISLHFRDFHGEEFFLLQVINVGRATDELKFVFNSPAAGTGVRYSESENLVGESDISRLQAEITYHSDGSILQKLLGRNERSPTVYKNPFGEGTRRTPLNQIKEWTPIIRYWIVRYDLCKKPQSSNSAFLPFNEALFNGEPFGCILYLGKTTNPTPVKRYPAEIIYRLRNVADEVDLLVQIGKSTYQGTLTHIPNTSIPLWITHNVIEIVGVKE